MTPLTAELRADPSAEPPAQPRLVIAGLSVRAAAQAAQRDGFRVIGLDLFGDADTRAACDTWQPLRAAPGAPWQVDADALRVDLTGLVRDEPDLLGVVLTGGLVAEGAGLVDLPLPLLGTAPADIARLRDPATFFAALDAYGIAHPEVALCRPVEGGDGTGPAVGSWLRKDFAGSGGVPVRSARPDDAAAPGVSGVYWQRQVAGEPVSVTLIGDGRQAAVLGVNRQRVDPAPGAPFRFGGVVGPLPLVDHADHATLANHADGARAVEARSADGVAGVDGALQTRLQGLADRLVRHFALRGLCSLDLMLAPDGPPQVLELNPRPSASLALYGQTGGQAGGPAGGLMRAHLDAVRHGHLPDAAAIARLRGDDGPADRAVRGQAICYAERAMNLDAAALAWLAAATDTLGLADRPAILPFGQAVPAGAPLCSVTAAGRSVGAVQALLDARRQAVANGLARLAALPAAPVS